MVSAWGAYAFGMTRRKMNRAFLLCGCSNGVGNDEDEGGVGGLLVNERLFNSLKNSILGGVRLLERKVHVMAV